MNNRLKTMNFNIYILIGGFIRMQFNPADWGQDVRIKAVCFTICLIAVYQMVKKNYVHEHRRQSNILKKQQFLVLFNILSLSLTCQ